MNGQNKYWNGLAPVKLLGDAGQGTPGTPDPNDVNYLPPGTIIPPPDNSGGIDWTDPTTLMIAGGIGLVVVLIIVSMSKK